MKPSFDMDDKPSIEDQYIKINLMKLLLIQKNVENISSNNMSKYITDDQFFDDFFSDDEE